MTDNGSLRTKRKFKHVIKIEANKNVSATNPAEEIAGAAKTLAGKLAASSPDRFPELKPDDFEDLGEIGHGASGTVKKVKHRPTDQLFAKKSITVDVNISDTETLKKQIFRELQFMHTCRSDHIVDFFGASVLNGEVFMYMEYMDCGSLHNVYKTLGQIEEAAIGKIALAVLEGLVYLYETHRIIHRDIKPSNVLVNSAGGIKLCDFGVSGEAQNSVVKSFVGTSLYMAPERIKAVEYTVRGDVWSLGLTLLEVAVGKFPLPPNLKYFELLQLVTNEPAPTLPPDQFSEEFEGFISKWCVVAFDW